MKGVHYIKMKGVKSKMFIAVILVSLYFSFFFLIIFQCFSSACFLVFSMFSAPLP